MTMLLLALSVSVDALGVGLSFGMRGIQIRPAAKLLLCLCSLLYACLAMLLGRWLVPLLPPAAANLAGSAILCCMGLSVIVGRGFRRQQPDCSGADAADTPKTVFEWAIRSLGITICVIKNPQAGDIDHSGAIDSREAFLLGFALSVDVLGAGIGIALTGRPSPLFPVIVGAAQMGFLCTGCACGKWLQHRLSDRVIAWGAGLLLIAVGIVKFF